MNCIMAIQSITTRSRRRRHRRRQLKLSTIKIPIKHKLLRIMQHHPELVPRPSSRRDRRRRCIQRQGNISSHFKCRIYVSVRYTSCKDFLLSHRIQKTVAFEIFTSTFFFGRFSQTRPPQLTTPTSVVVVAFAISENRN